MEAEMQTSPRRLWLEATVACLAVGAAYTWLLSAIMVDDVLRYITELGDNRFDWDLGHLWMQPLALLVYRATAGALGIVGTLEAVNVASVALGCAVFYETLRRLGHGMARSALAMALVAVSFNLLSLGPTAHIKLMVFPALAMAFRHAVIWERKAEDGDWSVSDAVWSGVWLGIASNLLVSVLPAGVFMAALMWFYAVRQGQSPASGFKVMLPFGLALTLSGLAGVLLAYAVAHGSNTTEAETVRQFVFGGLKEKQDLHVGVASLSEMPLRFAFSLINNFAYLPSLGPLGRAWMWDMLPSVQPVFWSLLGQAALAAASGLCIAWIVGVGVLKSMQRRPGFLIPIAYILGATSFSFYYNLNDPEHWFHFTLPIVFIALHMRWRVMDKVVLGLWLPLLLVVNMAGYGVPKAVFALEARESQMREAIGSSGLYVGFAAYPGEPDSSLFRLGGIRRFNIDLVQMNETKADNTLLLQRLGTEIDAAHARGGRVLVFRALDPFDWRGPVMQVALAGLTRDEIRRFLESRYEVTGPEDVGGFPAWKLGPRARP
ncbi:hypothetical protein D621_17710 [beta proteobacterium AAP51]|nr:hypothetical protein D621_17710 [beta proteobacterium AAP51]